MSQIPSFISAGQLQRYLQQQQPEQREPAKQTSFRGSAYQQDAGGGQLPFALKSQMLSRVGGRSGGVAHYNSTPIDTGDAGFIQLNDTVVQNNPDVATMQENARRMAIQQERRDRVAIDADGAALAETLKQVAQQNFRSAMAEYQAVNKFSQTATAQQSQEAFGKWAQKYPDIAMRLQAGPPPSKEEQAAQMQQQQLAQFSQDYGVPTTAAVRDKDGNLTIDKGYIDLQKLNLERKKALADVSNSKEQFKFETDALKAEHPLLDMKNPYDAVNADGSNNEQFVHFEKTRQEDARVYSEKVRQLRSQLFGQRANQPVPTEPGTQLPVSQAQFEANQKKAQAAGLALVVDDADYQALEPGQFFIDDADGKKYQKPVADQSGG